MLKLFMWFVVGGGILGLVVGLLLNGGYFETWEQLPATRLPNPRIHTIIDGHLAIKLSDATLYTERYCPNYTRCWKAVPEITETPKPLMDRFDIIKPCWLSIPMWLTKPWNATDCIQGRSYYVDGYGDFAYVLDQQGRIWEWSHSTSARQAARVPFFLAIFGNLCGLVLAVVYGIGRALLRYLKQV